VGKYTAAVVRSEAKFNTVAVSIKERMDPFLPLAAVHLKCLPVI
jgi:hypothetical protein